MNRDMSEGDVFRYQKEVRDLRAELEVLRSNTERPKRLTLSQILEAHLDRMRASAGGEHSTVKLTRNAKGDTQIEVSVRTGEHVEVATVEDAAGKAREIYDVLRSLYPLQPPADAS